MQENVNKNGHSEKNKDEVSDVTKNGHVQSHREEADYVIKNRYVESHTAEAGNVTVNVFAGSHKEESGDGAEYARGDQVLEAIGDWGKWQRNNFILLGLFVMPVAWPVLWMTFMNAKMDYWCARPLSASNMSIELWKNVSGQTKDSCSMLDRDWETWAKDGLIKDSLNATLVPCTSWEYDTSQFTNTITSEWDLVCSRSMLKSTVQTLYFVGTISGDFGFGILADVLGRKPVIVPLLLILSITGTIAAFVPTLTGFIAVRFINAMADMGIFSNIMCWLLEVVGGNWTTKVGIGIEAFWVAGWLILAGFGYIIKDWRNVMLAISLPGLSAAILFWLMPESPKWLVATGKISKAETIVRQAAKCNGRSLPEHWKLYPIQKVEKKKASLFDLFRYPNIRMKTLILWYAWFVNAFAYFGLSMNMGSLGGSVFVTFTINGLLEIPANCAALWIALKKGRRLPFAGCMLLCGLSLLCIMFIPRGEGHSHWPAVALSLFGKFCITFSFAVVILYTTEIFPTELRTTGIGICSTVGRVGGIVAPWVGELGTKFHPYIPVLVFGLSSLLAGILAFKLPETMGEKLPDTLEEAEMVQMGQFPKLTIWRKNKKEENV